MGHYFGIEPRSIIKNWLYQKKLKRAISESGVKSSLNYRLRICIHRISRTDRRSCQMQINTQGIKKMLHDEGIDIVGIADAAKLICAQPARPATALMPTARSVIVMAVLTVWRGVLAPISSSGPGTRCRPRAYWTV